MFYSGHATAIEGGQDVVLLPADADADDPAATGYRLSTLYGNLAALGVERLRFCLDASFAAALGAEPAAEAPAPASVVAYPVIGDFGTETPPHWIVLTAGTGAEPTYEHPEAARSVFVDALVSGLGGEADAAGDADGLLVAGELAEFVREEVQAVVGEATGGSQTPALFGPENESIAHHGPAINLGSD